MPPEDEPLAQRLHELQRQIALAAERGGRDPNEITIVGATKTVPPAKVAAAYRLGLGAFGENRVKEAALKITAVRELIGADASWHLIGHLQTNKARAALPLFDLIHSVDSLRLARDLNRHASESGVAARVLLEVNVAGEATKYGFAPAQLVSLAGELDKLPCLCIEGLMTVAPPAHNPDDVRPIFAALRLLRDRFRSDFPNHAWRHLSMGMSDDYPVAVEEGATLVRIGRAIFGDRPKLDRAPLPS